MTKITKSGSNPEGVEIREKSMRILFWYQGKQRKETLYLNEVPLAPTPPNIKYAGRVAAEVRKKVANGEFRYIDYFPHSPRAAAPVSGVDMLHDVMDTWLNLLDRKPSTKSQYGRRLRTFWKVYLPNQPVRDVRYSDILTALNKGTWKSGKSRNNELSMIRQVFEHARKDNMIDANPCDEVERASYQAPDPDPFSLDEVEIVLAHLRQHAEEQVRNYYEFMFFTGLRTSESIAADWRKVDFRKRELKVDGARVYDEESDSTKTSVSRIVKLNSRAMAALERQKKWTYLQPPMKYESPSGKIDEIRPIFLDPATGKPWVYSKITDVRWMWEPVLRKVGIRYRRPYNTRHTYATIGLMSGAKPGFLATQLGHSLKMFFEVYAQWINGADDDREMEKIEAALQPVKVREGTHSA